MSIILLSFILQLGLSVLFTDGFLSKYSNSFQKHGFIGTNVRSVDLEKEVHSSTEFNSDEIDYVVIGSGIGGLSSAALLSYYGYSVVVLESHYLPGGVAHTFEHKGFKFDAGPSLWNGMKTPPYNPLRQILELVGEGESVVYTQYDGWIMHTPDGSFKFTVGANNFEEILKKFGGPTALSEWKLLNKLLEPVTELSVAVPPLTLRSDAFVSLTLLPHMLKLMKGAIVASKVEGSFKALSKTVVTDKFLENWFEFLSFALSGLPADDTIAAAVAYTMRDLHQEGAALDYPVGGSGAVVDALIRGVTKTGKGHVLLSSHVEEILVEGGRATGVRLRRNNKTIKAKRAVISNASVWDTMKLLSKEKVGNNAFIEKSLETPITGSFMHLHLGIDATGLPVDLESHYTVINKWDPIDAPQNHVIISIPSVLDPTLAPPGCHVIHAYAAANEPFDLWDKKMTSSEYEALKAERSEFLWRAIERSIPDVRSRVVVDLSASPLTHKRFNRRYKGTFGPALRAGKEKFPYPKTPIDGLLCCGDSIFPGIGVPAVAVSGANAASSTVSVWEHLRMLEDLYPILNKGK